MWKCWSKMTRLSPSGAEKRITIGKLGAPHGIHGEVRVIPLTDFAGRFEQLKEIMAGDELLHIESVKYHKQFVLMRFREYPDREDVTRLTGRMLTVPRSEAMPLEEGEYYTFDIIGLSVETSEGTSLGKVEQVLRTGSNDVYAVRTEEGRELLIPALKRVVKEINIKEGRMVVELPEEIE